MFLDPNSSANGTSGNPIAKKIATKIAKTNEKTKSAKKTSAKRVAEVVSLPPMDETPIIIPTYHRTKDMDAVISIGLNGILKEKLKRGSLYGSGFYASRSLSSHLRSNMTMYGGYMLETFVDIRGFISVDETLAKKVWGAKHTIKDQLSHYDLTTKSNPSVATKIADYSAKVMTEWAAAKKVVDVDVRRFISSLDLQKKVPGFIYNGKGDGPCLVVYDVSRVKVERFSIHPKSGKTDKLNWADFGDGFREQYTNDSRIAVHMDMLPTFLNQPDPLPQLTAMFKKLKLHDKAAFLTAFHTHIEKHPSHTELFRAMFNQLPFRTFIAICSLAKKKSSSYAYFLTGSGQSVNRSRTYMTNSRSRDSIFGKVPPSFFESLAPYAYSRLNSKMAERSEEVFKSILTAMNTQTFADSPESHDLALKWMRSLYAKERKVYKYGYRSQMRKLVGSKQVTTTTFNLSKQAFVTKTKTVKVFKRDMNVIVEDIITRQSFSAQKKSIMELLLKYYSLFLQSIVVKNNPDIKKILTNWRKNKGAEYTKQLLSKSAMLDFDDEEDDEPKKKKKGKKGVRVAPFA